MKKTIIAILLLCALSAAEEVPKIAVYVVGGKSAGEDRALTAYILSALINSGRYEAVERSDDFVAQINQELETQYSGAVDESQIRRVGMRAGVQFVCVAEITPAFGAYQLSARIVNVETAKVAGIGVASSDMESMVEMEILANDIVAKMLGLKRADQVLGESDKDKRRREAADAKRRKKIETDRLKSEKEQERAEDALRREKERADKAERREQEKAEKAERRGQEKAEKVERLEREETDNKSGWLGRILFPDLGEECGDRCGDPGLWSAYANDGKWHFYSLSLPYLLPPGGFGLGIGGDWRLAEATIRKYNHRTWEPRIDVVLNMYLGFNDFWDVGIMAFNGWTVSNVSDKPTRWRWFLGYGAACLGTFVIDGNESFLGIGVGGQIGLEYAGLNYKRPLSRKVQMRYDGGEVRFEYAELNYGGQTWLLNIDIRPMYRIIPKDIKKSYFGITIGINTSWCKEFYIRDMQ